MTESAHEPPRESARESPREPDRDPARQHQALVDELWDFEGPSASEDRFRTAADGAPDPVERAVLLTQAARALGLQERFDDALDLLEQISSGQPHPPEVTVRLRLERGRIENSRGDPPGARPLFESAHEQALAAGLENLAVDALHMVAIVAPLDEQAALHDAAIEMASRAADPRAREWLPSLLNNAAWTRFDQGDVESALNLFERALAERVQQGKSREMRIARWSVARAMRELGRAREALAIRQELLRANEAAGLVDPYVQEAIDECLRVLAATESSHSGRARAG